jgi:hypothetical protein
LIFSSLVILILVGVWWEFDGSWELQLLVCKLRRAGRLVVNV